MLIQRTIAFSMIGRVVLSHVPWSIAVSRYVSAQRRLHPLDQKGMLGIYGDYFRGDFDRKTRGYVHASVALISLAVLLFAFSSSFAS